MKNIFSKFILTLLTIVFLCCTANAQLLNDLNGRPVTIKTDADIKGSPYLADNWLPGSVRLATGVSYKANLYLKYNLAEDELYFKGKNDEPLLFVVPVTDFTIVLDGHTKRYKKGFNVTGFTDENFFEVLADGTFQLIKKTKKVILESRQYNSPTVDKNLMDVNQYYLVKDGKATQIKQDKKSILTAIGTKQPELEAYIRTNNLKLKDDDDLAKLIIYYNSL